MTRSSSSAARLPVVDALKVRRIVRIAALILGKLRVPERKQSYVSGKSSREISFWRRFRLTGTKDE